MREVPPNPDHDFDFRLDRLGELGFRLGNARLSLSIEAAYELQYQLAEMLAFVETFEDLEGEAPRPDEASPSNVVPFEGGTVRKLKRQP